MKKLETKIKGFIVYNLGVIEKRFFWKTKKYLKKYYNIHNQKPISQNKTIIYMLDGRAYSGGLTDIFRGIISMFKFAKEIGFDFRINFVYPYNLCNYLEPNLYNWQISENEISYNSKSSVPLKLYSVYLKYGRTREFEYKFQLQLLKNFVNKNKTKQQYHIYTNSEWAQGYEYSLLFNELFKPAKPLQKALNYHKKKLGAEYISMTFRFQQLLGDFVDKDSTTDKTGDVLDHLKQSENLNEKNLQEQSELQLRAIIGDFKNKKISVPLNEIDKCTIINKCINKINEIHTTLFPEVKILVTADSEVFLSEVSKLDFVYAISAISTHGGSNVNEKYNIFLKSYIDILLLAEAKKLHLLCTKSMYHSGFAKYASYINNREYEEINF